jgi:hypothetical protein
MTAAQDFIRDNILISIAHNNLFAFGHHDTIDNARLMGGPCATPTQCLHLEHVDSICQLNKTLRAGKQHGPKVRENSEGKYINFETIDNHCQLSYLLWRIELRFIADKKINAMSMTYPLQDFSVKVGLVIHFKGLGAQAEARRNDATASSIFTGEDQTLTATRLVIMCSL